MLYLKSVYILGYDVRRHFELQIPSFVLSHSIAGSSVPIAVRKSGAAASVWLGGPETTNSTIRYYSVRQESQEMHSSY